MPRIAAASIEEHVRNQGNRILDAGRDLFISNGYRATDMSDIARSMGLARNSLYRYYSSKDHILVAVVEREMEPYFAELEALEARIVDPLERINAWVGLQMEIAAGPCHAMIGLLGEMPPQSKALQKKIIGLHTPLKKSLRKALEQVLAGSGRDVDIVTAMISSMVQAAAGVAMRSNDTDRCSEELRLTINRVLMTS
ncbi:MAG: TetR/AcrR family transcriptional regulator [Gammaproteobacteria bacterium]|nr:TetR/AcrR family transcriptional regulator [Gammaproteobacteria bacterium]